MTEKRRMTIFPAGDGEARLEGEIRCGSSPGVVICHPHPLYGGSMDSAVVGALFSALSGAGRAVLRFNFRGVGGSTGRHGDGEGEVRDALGAIEHLRTACGCGEIVLAGYSFGAAVALKALEEARVSRFVAVALPTLVAAGDMDEICRIGDVEQVASFRNPPEKLVLRGCDHFFSSVESMKELCDNVVRFTGGNPEG